MNSVKDVCISALGNLYSRRKKKIRCLLFFIAPSLFDYHQETTKPSAMPNRISPQ